METKADTIKSDLCGRIQQHFHDSITVKQKTSDMLSSQIANTGLLLYQRLVSGNKILCCGNGGSAADCQHFVAELVNRFEIDRAPLAAISLTTDTSTLTAIGNDYSFDLTFKKQVQALGSKGDILFAITTSGNSTNIFHAVKAAHAARMIVVLLTGKDGGLIQAQLQPTDHLICIPAQSTARIQETHILTIHCLCDAIDYQIQLKEPTC